MTDPDFVLQERDVIHDQPATARSFGGGLSRPSCVVRAVACAFMRRGRVRLRRARITRTAVGITSGRRSRGPLDSTDERIRDLSVHQRRVAQHACHHHQRFKRHRHSRGGPMRRRIGVRFEAGGDRRIGAGYSTRDVNELPSFQHDVIRHVLRAGVLESRRRTCFLVQAYSRPTRGRHALRRYL